VALPQIQALRLPTELARAVYEQVTMELIELRETEAARMMLRQTQVLLELRQEDPERYARLERLTKEALADLRDLYGAGMTKDKRRAQLAAALSQEVSVVPPQRLMSLVGQALKWQQAQGELPAGTTFDLFRGTARARAEEHEAPVREQERQVKAGSKKSHPEAARFSPDGLTLAVGSLDGFIELWDPVRGKIRRDLKYQADETFMMHDTAVLALAWSRDSELLASGSQDGQVRVWRAQTGQCLKKFDRAHAEGVTSVSFSRDGTQVSGRGGPAPAPRAGVGAAPARPSPPGAGGGRGGVPSARDGGTRAVPRRCCRRRSTGRRGCTGSSRGGCSRSSGATRAT